jgi:hypothetical protein
MTSGKVLENVVVPRGPDVGCHVAPDYWFICFVAKIVEFSSFELVTSIGRLCLGNRSGAIAPNMGLVNTTHFIKL